MPRLKRPNSTDQYPRALELLARFGGDVEKAARAWMAAVNEWSASRTDAEIASHNRPDVAASREDLSEPDLEQQALALFRPYIITSNRRTQ